MSFPTVERNRSQNATCQITVDSAAGTKWKGLKDRSTGLRLRDHRDVFCPNSLQEQLLGKDHYYWENLFEQFSHAPLIAISKPAKFYGGPICIPLEKVGSTALCMTKSLAGGHDLDLIDFSKSLLSSFTFKWARPPRTHPLRKKVKGFANLKKGWDSYEANPPSEAAIKNTLTFLGVLEMLELSPDWVEPTSDDSIMLEINVGGTLQEWDFYSDGDVAVLYEKDGKTIDCKMVNPELWELAHHVTLFPNDAR